MLSKKIENIDRESVHRICSGQVVLTLATAVKELVENSLDAKATNIEVRLRDYGQTAIEVVDNGHGVAEHNFHGLTQKHHTSKIQDFGDLSGLQTFGFRGEALSSLCALACVSVMTRHTSAQVATRLEFDHQGCVTSRANCARQTGTTVNVNNIFSTLAVRHKEFQRNIKKEYAKMLNVLTAYAIISSGVRITCTNQLLNGKNKQTVLSTNGHDTIRENLACVFGIKQLRTLIDIEQVRPSTEVCEEMNIKLSDDVDIGFRLTGVISRCSHGDGRGSADRQFYFINQRPCDPSKISKVVNEVYHTYNRHQYPTVVLHVIVDSDQLDVNVTPDKRKVFVADEKILLAVIKTSLIKMYGSTVNSYGINNPLSAFMVKERHGDVAAIVTSTQGNSKNGPMTPPPVLSSLKRSFSSAFAKPDAPSIGKSEDSSVQQSQKQPKLTAYLGTQSDVTSDTVVDRNITIGSDNLSESTQNHNQQLLLKEEILPVHSHNILSTIPNECKICSKTSCSCPNETNETQTTILNNCTGVIHQPVMTQESILCKTCGFRQCICQIQTIKESSTETNIPKLIVINTDRGIGEKSEPQSNAIQHSEHTNSSNISASTNRVIDTYQNVKHVDKNFELPSEHNSPVVIDNVRIRENSKDKIKDGLANEIDGGMGNFSIQMDGYTDTQSPEEEVIVQYDNERIYRRKQKTVPFSMDDLKQTFSSLSCSTYTNTNSDFSRSFRAKIDVTDNQSAEAELQREIHKDMFGDMEVLGQFNLGFIIAKHGDDLFIVDQHASDEKYNFEVLQATVALEGQTLIRPQRLELTASNETILIDNLHIFTQNGFQIQLDSDAAATERVSLIAVPVSKNWLFGKSDIEEMIFMLTESPGIMCRPSRIRQMFASRACRKSIMIGTALDTPQMKQVLRHMGEIEQPWNCPHGRPTMRHLINLRMLPRDTPCHTTVYPDAT